jgi:hypothetical protein
MANLDTRQKRSSGMHVSLPIRILPHRTGAVTQLDRQELAYMYTGITAAVGAGILEAMFGLVTKSLDDTYQTVEISDTHSTQSLDGEYLTKEVS